MIHKKLKVCIFAQNNKKKIRKWVKTGRKKNYLNFVKKYFFDYQTNSHFLENIFLLLLKINDLFVFFVIPKVIVNKKTFF